MTTLRTTASSSASRETSTPPDVPSRFTEILDKFGLPKVEQIRYFSDYVLYYDTRNKTAFWVYEHLTADSVRNSHVARRFSEYLPDESIHRYFRSDNSDYWRSGYSRGHLAAAGNHKLDQSSYNETYKLCNMSPQIEDGFNGGAWKYLEEHVRRLTNSYSHIYCFSGPLFLSKRESDKMYIKFEVIGANKVSVPTHFYKIMLCERSDRRYDVEAYVLPHEKISESIPLESFYEQPDTIEKAAGFLFFENVPTEEVVKINGRPRSSFL